MTGRSFIDTNIIVYAHDSDAGEKHRVAAAKLEELWRKDTPPAVSIQVLQETYAVLMKKGMPARELSQLIEDLLKWDVIVNNETVLLEGMRLQHKFKISIWDAFIIAAAKEAGARNIISEDLSHTVEYEGIKIFNPFTR